MPRFDELANVTAGVGGGEWAINGRVVATNAGGADWLRLGIAIAQIGDKLYTCAHDGQPVLVDEQGANELAAGGGVYAAKVNGVVRVSNSLQTWPNYGVGDVGPDGTLLLYDPQNKFQGQFVKDLQSLGGTSWSGLDLHFRPLQSPDLPAPVVVDGEIYGYRRGLKTCCYLAPAIGFVIQWLDRPVGKVLLPKTPAAFRPDLHEHTDGSFFVTCALTEGERWSDVRSFRVFPHEMTEALTVAETIPGCHGELLTDPEAYFRSLVVGTVATNYPTVLPQIQPALNKYGITIQHDSAGTLRPRLFLPNPTGEFERAVDITDNPPQTSPDGGWRWIDRNPAAGYTPAPCSGVATVTLVSLTATPASLQGGGSATAVVTLSGPAPAGGAAVGLSSSSSVAHLPGSVFVPEGVTSASVPVTTSAVSTSTSLSLFASYAGVTRSAPLTVTAAATGDLEARVAALEADVATLKAQMATTAKKGDPVTVTLTGKIGP